MAVIFNDTFTEDSETTLASHTPDTGTSWTLLDRIAGDETLGVDAIADTVIGEEGGLGDGVLYTADATYTSDNYKVTVSVVDPDSSDDTTILAVRISDADNMYALRFNADIFQLHKCVSGSWSAVSADQGEVVPDESGHTVYLQISGSTLSAGVDDVQQVSESDASLSGVHKAGLGMGAIVESGDDMSVQEHTSFEVDELPPSTTTSTTSTSSSSSSSSTSSTSTTSSSSSTSSTSTTSSSSSTSSTSSSTTSTSTSSTTTSVSLTTSTTSSSSSSSTSTTSTSSSSSSTSSTSSSTSTATSIAYQPNISGTEEDKPQVREIQSEDTEGGEVITN